MGKDSKPTKAEGARLADTAAEEPLGTNERFARAVRNMLARPKRDSADRLHRPGPSATPSKNNDE